MRTEELLALEMFGRGSRLWERVEMLMERGREFSPRVSRARLAVGALALLGCVITGSLAPRWIAFAQQPAFEAASIRLIPSSKFGPGYGAMRFNSAGIDCEGVYLIQLIAEAYQVPFSRISGADSRTRDLLQREQYDIAAKADPVVSKDQLRGMLQTMLADRFKLTLHHESKTESVHKVTIAKNGTTLKRLEVEGEGFPQHERGGGCHDVS